jgi:hypothetical protein
MRRGDQSKTVEQLQICVNLLEMWINSARQSVVAGVELQHAREELSQAVAIGRLFPLIERLRASIQSHADGGDLLQQLDLISSTIQYM